MKTIKSQYRSSIKVSEAVCRRRCGKYNLLSTVNNFKIFELIGHPAHKSRVFFYFLMSEYILEIDFLFANRDCYLT